MKKRPKKVVLDTSVLISATLFTGRASKIITLLQSKTIILVISKEILEEYVRALAYPKFSLTEEEIESLVSEVILPFAETVRPPKFEKQISQDRDDDKFLSCAKAAKADVIVSGDKHLLELREFEDIPIRNLNSFLHEFDV